MSNQPVQSRGEAQASFSVSQLLSTAEVIAIVGTVELRLFVCHQTHKTQVERQRTRGTFSYQARFFEFEDVLNFALRIGAAQRLHHSRIQVLHPVLTLETGRAI